MTLTLACGRTDGWSVMVYNFTNGEDLVARVSTADGVTWSVVEHGGIRIVFLGNSRPPDLNLTLFVASTCEPIGTVSDLPRRHTAVLVDTGRQITVAEDDPDGLDNEVMATLTSLCVT